MPHNERVNVGRILILCTGNICRSPMAAALLQYRLADRGISVESAGIGAVVGAPADPLVIDLMIRRKLDVTAHRGRQFDGRLGKNFDLHLVMDSEQRHVIERTWPLFRGRVHRLGHYGGFDIADPYRQPREAFEEALELIDQGLEQWLLRLTR